MCAQAAAVRADFANYEKKLQQQGGQASGVPVRTGHVLPSDHAANAPTFPGTPSYPLSCLGRKDIRNASVATATPHAAPVPGLTYQSDVGSASSVGVNPLLSLTGCLHGDMFVHTLAQYGASQKKCFGYFRHQG